MPAGKLHIVPLGGLGEFGMNCMAIRWKDDIIVIDAGMMFPEGELLGVDIVVPALTYLIENREKVRGVLLTHGHEDHIGGIPWLISELNVPIYGTEFTLAYVEDKLEENGLLDSAELNEMLPGKRFQIGPFTIHPIQVNHSIVDAVSLAIRTPLGVIIHTGDFKIDLTPTDNKTFDLQAFAEYGKEGVLALLQDSTNVERSGYTPSERAVRPKLEEIFVHSKRRLFISCFSSSIHRIKMATEMAYQFRRKIALVGRSITESTEIAQDLGHIDLPCSAFIAPNQIRDYTPEQVLVLISGTQGEPLSALSRAAVDNHRHAKIEPGDTVVLSSRVIPGNEKAIYRVIDHLFRREAKVIYNDGSEPPVHVSGHASQEELKMMINLVRPQYFIPIHGEYRQLKRHAQIAAGMKGLVGNVIMIETGDILEFDELGARRVGQAPVGRICIDSGSNSDIVEDLVIRDRKHLSEDGFVMPILAINKLTGRLEGIPEIVMRGFAGAPDDNEFIEDARGTVRRTFEHSTKEEVADYGLIKEKIRVDLRRYINRNTQRRPLVIPVIVEI
ncbi:MAG: ribonuclease J [Acidobacteria bacterium]|nr:MAG: ribonuclease J [Acidobacteriota bacterium]